MKFFVGVTIVILVGVIVAFRPIDIAIRTPAATSGINIGITQPMPVPTIPKTVVAPEITFPEQFSEQQQPTEAIGVGVTKYAGSSADRVANITVGVSSINGTILKPGEEFSTVAALGEITAEKGYKEEKVFRDGAVASGLGGGLCQVSTTLFQAVLDAGLRVTERANHTFTVPYYPTGLDATIAGPHPDFRFINDTMHDIVITGIVKDGTVTFTITGVPDGRVSTVSDVVLTDKDPAEPARIVPVDFLQPGEQKCVGTPHDGVKASVDYTVTYADGTARTKTFNSTYRSMTPICYIGAAR